MMSEAEIDELAANIKEKGLFVQIDMWIDDLKDPNAVPELIEGRGRLAALKRLGDPRSPPYSTSRGKRPFRYIRASEDPGFDPVAYIFAVNVKRRHLTPKQKRDTIERFIELYPTASDRKVAEAVNVDHKMVGRVRRSKQNGSMTQIAHRPEERAKAALGENPDASITEVAEKVGVSERTVVNAKQELSQPRPETKSEPEEKPEPKPALVPAPQEKNTRIVLPLPH